MGKLYEDSLNETYNLFKTQHASIIGQGYGDIATDATLFENYVTSLVAGADADSQMQMAQLIVNSNTETLTESIGAISPIASLQGPLIRKLWPTFALKNAVKTEVAKSPALTIVWEKPYYETGDGVRHYVPECYRDEDGNYGLAANLAGNYVNKVINIAAGSNSASFTFDSTKTADATNAGLGSDVAAGSRIKKQPLDPDFLVRTITLYEAADSASAEKKLVINVNRKLSVENVVVYDFSGVMPTGATTDGGKTVSGTLLVRVNLITGVCQVSVIRTDTTATAVDTVDVAVRAHYSTEYNENVTSWQLEIAREDIRIGTGEHYVAPLTVESLKDMKALYQLDGTKKIVDIMTNAFAMNVDTRILAFLKNSFLDQPGSGEFSNYPTASQYLAVFDVKPMVGYAGGPKAWREELKPVIDHLAARIKNQTHLGRGIFKIVGNPLDTALISNVEWTFRGGAQTKDGVAVDYSLGQFYGASYTYQIVSTEIVPQGMLYIVFIPEGEDQLTYNYWAYTFCTELGYRDPNHAMVPALMMTKRDVLKNFMPAIAAVKILGNDAGAAYDPFRDFIPTKQFDGTYASTSDLTAGSDYSKD